MSKVILASGLRPGDEFVRYGDTFTIKSVEMLTVEGSDEEPHPAVRAMGYFNARPETFGTTYLFDPEQLVEVLNR